jgi:UPF0755 protein
LSQRHKASGTFQLRPGQQPRSPAEQIEPTRAPQRPGGRRRKKGVKRMNGLTRLLSGILTLLFVVTLGLAGGLAWFEQAMRSEGPLTEKRIIAIPAGDSTYMIAERLEEQGAISSQTLFLAKFMSDNVIARYAGRGERHLKAGEYEI